MSNNAIYHGDPYHVIDVEGHELELEPVDEGRGRPQWVDVMTPTLVIDPTDDQWFAVRRPIRAADLTSLGAQSPRNRNQPLPPPARP